MSSKEEKRTQPERLIWKRVVKNVMKHVKNYNVFFERIENRVNNGTPDGHYSVFGYANSNRAFIEIKSVPLPKRVDHITIGWRPAQPIWIRDYLAAGGKVFLLLGVGKKEILFIELTKPRLLALTQKQVPLKDVRRMADWSCDGHRLPPEAWRDLVETMVF